MRLNIPSRSFSKGHQTVLSNIIPVEYKNNTNVDLPWRQDSDLRIAGADLNAYCAVALSDISIYQWHTWSYGTEY